MPKNCAPPNKQTVESRPDGLYATIPGEPDKPIAPPISYRGTGSRIDGSGQVDVLAVANANGEMKEIFVRRSDVLLKPRDFYMQLTEAGYALPADAESHRAIRSYINTQRERVSKRFLIVDRSGWHGDAF